MRLMGTGGQLTVTVAAIAAAVTAAISGISVSLWIAVTDHQQLVDALFNGAVVVAFTVVGAVIAAARPRNRVGWVMLVGGVLWSLGGAGADLAHHAIVVRPGSVPGAAAFAVAGSAVRSVGWYLVTLGVWMLFPDGRVASPRWRWLPAALVVIVIGAVLDPLTDPRAGLTNLGAWRNPIAPVGAGQLVSALAFVAHIGLSLVATVGVVAQLVVRWRRGDAFRRQQLRLFVTAAALPLIAVPIAFGTNSGGWVFGAAALPLPFAIGFAVLAHGLYDLRTAANRTVVWLTLSTVVASLYALVIAGVGSVLHRPPDVAWLSWAAAAVVAVSFAPLRDGLQRAVNRLTFGRWDEPYDVLAGLGQRLEAAADVDGLLSELVTELHGLGLEHVAICDLERRVLAGESLVGDSIEMTLTAYGHPVGRLVHRPLVTPLRNRDRRLLDDLAGHLGGVLYAHQLTLDLQRALERRVLAREEERRRLRRDLHDGLGPALAGHLLRLDLVARTLGPTSPAAGDIDTLRDELRSTVFEVRRVVEGLRPPALDELGLAGALAQMSQRLAAGTDVAIQVEAAGLPALPAAMEVAAFRIVSEAVANVVRHAAATTCRVSLESTGGSLRITVTDDGRGIDSQSMAGAGHGLHTMRERAEELRGCLRVHSARGTTILAELPLPPAAPRVAGETVVAAPA